MTAFAARYDVSTQEISSTPADSEPCMCGSATLVTVTSSTCMMVTVMTVAVMAHRRSAPTGASPLAGASALSTLALNGRHRHPRRRDARCRSLALQHLPNLLLGDGDLDARPLLLEQHGDARVARRPSTVERLGHLLEREVRDAHGHADLAAERRGERDVLVGQFEGEGRRIEDARQELIDEAVEGAAAPAGALAHRLPKHEGLDTRLDAHREDLGQRRLHRVTGAVVHELGDRARADGPDVVRLVANRIEHRLEALVHLAIAAHPER